MDRQEDCPQRLQNTMDNRIFLGELARLFTQITLKLRPRLFLV
jgi:hypothetical protein